MPSGFGQAGRAGKHSAACACLENNQSLNPTSLLFDSKPVAASRMPAIYEASKRGGQGGENSRNSPPQETHHKDKTKP
ncbi:MAG: hypothetical protein LBH43_00470 [Treponema sp.]|nr:hypothetical protein [Treponema sp.]